MVKLDKKWLIFQHILSCSPHTSSFGVAALGFLCVEAFILILGKVLSCRFDLITGQKMLPSQVVFSHVGEQKIGSSKSGEYGGWSTSSIPQQPLQPQTCVQEHCPGETEHPSSVFWAVHKMSLVLLSKVLNYLSRVGFSGRKQCS